MNPELIWLSNCVADSATSARRARYNLDSLQEQRREVSGVWNDSFAVEISRRYLDPMTEDAAVSVSELLRQADLLGKCIESLERSSQALLLAGTESLKIADAISEADGIFRGLDTEFGEAVNEASRASSHSARAMELLNQADAEGR